MLVDIISYRKALLKKQTYLSHLIYLGTRTWKSSALVADLPRSGFRIV